MKIFVSWEGTDENFHYMISASSRLENFDRWGIKDMFQSMLKYDSDTTPDKRPLDTPVSDCIANFMDPAKACVKLGKKKASDDYTDYKKANP